MGSLFYYNHPSSNNLTKYTVTNDGITFTNTGLYKVTLTQNLNSTSTTERTNLALQLVLNGSLIGPKASNGYIRNAGGHQESTASLIFVVSVSGGQKLGFLNTQLTTYSYTITCPSNGLVFLIKEMQLCKKGCFHPFTYGVYPCDLNLTIALI